MNYSEKVSKRVLEALIPRSTMDYHRRQSNHEYDFDLQYCDGTTAAVEITSSVDETLAQTTAAIRSKRKGGSVSKAVTCQKSWLIFPTKSSLINLIRKNADRELAKLEQEGFEKFYYIDNSSSIREICCRLNITGGGVIRSEGAPTIKIGFPVGGGAVGASCAIKAGEAEAWKPDNRKKLSMAPTAERHLVIYIDASNGLPWTALTSFVPPSTLPKIPKEITNLWLVGHSEQANEFVVWYAGTQQTWQYTRIPSSSELSI